MNQDLTSLICLFHHKDQAHAALEDLLKAGIPETNITLIGDAGSRIAADTSTLDELNVPARDKRHLLDGLKDGGAILSVSAISDHVDKVDAIFKSHKADKIDEATVADDMSGVDTFVDSTEDVEIVAEEEILLVADQAHNTVYVYKLAPATPMNGEDVDPRELGLDDRMAPVKDLDR